MRQVDERQLPLVEKGERIDVPLDQILRKRSFCAAIALCVQVTGMDDKEVYIPLGIDAGHWSRMLKGDANFPVGTRVIAVKVGATDSLRIGCIGVTIGPREDWCGVHYYLVDWGVHGDLRSWEGAIRPLPPEDDVTAYDRAHRDVELEVSR